MRNSTLVRLAMAERQAAARRAGIAFVEGLCLGAGAMYLFDPDRGRRRRSAARARLVHLAHQTGITLGKAARDATHRAEGRIAAARHLWRREQVPDGVLTDRVRALLGRVVSHPSSIRTEVLGGVVTLGGPILAHEVAPLLRRVGRIDGVRGIANQLEPHATADGIPGLQGPARPRAPRPELLQARWAPSVQVVMGGLATLVAAHGVRRGGEVGALETLGGLAVLARAVGNRPWRQLLGIGAGPRAVDLQKTINLRAPLEDVFAYLADFRNFPRFMAHVREVRVSDGRSHWVVTGRAGGRSEWDVEVTRLEANREIAWRTLPGSRVEHAGVAQLERNADGTTRLQVRLSYNPLAGALGHAVAALLGADPKKAIDDDLLRFKSLLEEGKATGHEGQVTRDEVAPEPPGTVH